MTYSDGSLLRSENLTITSVEPEDGGLYFCFAKTSQSFGQEPGILNLNVISKDSAIYVPPKNLTVETGGKAIFTCKTHPNLKQMVSWVKKENDTLEILSLASEFLELSNVTQKDEGFYACVVGNEESHTQNIAYLRVHDPLPVPKLMEAPPNYITVSTKISIFR